MLPQHDLLEITILERQEILVETLREQREAQIEVLNVTQFHNDLVVHSEKLQTLERELQELEDKL